MDALQADRVEGDIELALPALNYGPIRVAIGAIQCVLQPARTVIATPIGEIHTSPKRKGIGYKLESGETIIITERHLPTLPNNVDGVLLRKLDGSLSWQSHKVLDNFLNAVEKNGWATVLDSITTTWSHNFYYRSEKQQTDGTVEPGSEGLRPPQIGALHAIGAHWSLSTQPATIVMPTGTGKTETMLAALTAYECGKTLVIVPSDALRSQTASKFLTLGWLPKLAVLDNDTPRPVVGVITKRPKSQEDLEIFERCNVFISTMAALQGRNVDSDNDDDDDSSEAPQDTADAENAPFNIPQEIAERVETLIVDEAHHVAARGWNRFREAFRSRRVLQFTATPFRRDGQLVDGQVIYSYPLRRAQEERYFKPIVFHPVYEPVAHKADISIAEIAIDCLRTDLEAGLNHLMMVRCKNIDRAKTVFSIYDRLAGDLKPLLLHSKINNASELIDTLRSGKSRIVVCVNMLGEGFDLPQLKVAAIHDIHKSLAILMQFTGRFTRTAGDKIGDAKIIANIAEPNVTASLERLYSEDADWNQLLSELSSDAAKEHARLIEFLQNAKPIVGEEDDKDTEISRRLLRPTLSTLVYDAKDFRPKAFIDGLPEHLVPYRAWLHKNDTLFFVTKSQPFVKWYRSRAVLDTEWSLFVLHHDKERKLLYLSSSDHSSDFATLAKAVGADGIISGETIFKSLGRITRLLFQNIGLKKHGRRNLSYAMYTGAQVAEALGLTEKGGSTKSNLSGIGWANGRQVSIGCSVKGRIWSRDKGTIPEFIEWSEEVGDKLQDPTIDLKDLLDNVLIPTEVTSLPDVEILCIEWPYEILREAEERVVLSKKGFEKSIMTCDIGIVSVDRTSNHIYFALEEASAGKIGEFRFSLGGENGFQIKQVDGDSVTITIGKTEKPLWEYFCERPPLFRFIDLTELDANLHIKPQSPQDLVISAEHYEPWNWEGVDITAESMWKHGKKRESSIQEHAARFFIDEGNFDVVFDDDAAGEAADLICIKLLDDKIRMVFVHCKFSGGKAPGERVKDVVEVCSQAVRSAKWNGRFAQLCSHIRRREEELRTRERPTRFLTGNTSDITQLLKINRLKPAESEIMIVQPGLSKAGITKDQSQVLAAALTYLKETIGVDMGIVCSE